MLKLIGVTLFIRTLSKSFSPPMSLLKISTVQTSLKWEDPNTNLAHIKALLKNTDNSTDVIILPEMFSTAYTMAPNKVAHYANHTLDWMQQQAINFNAVVTGSIVVAENQQYYNRLIWMQPDGKHDSYDKKHLFTMAGEHEAYTPGKERKTFQWKGWRICPLICYDLRFPEWSRYQDDFDLLIYVASWPVNRIQAWRTLLMARAIENQCYAIGVNRVGKDENDYVYSGHSSVVDYAGKVIYSISDIEQCATHILDLEKQNLFRKKLPFLKDKMSS